MRIVFFTKYPPLIGGVSSTVYWKTFLLGMSGIDVLIITNAKQASSAYKSIWRQEEKLRNVTVKFLLDNEELSYIPHSKSYITRLSSVGCDLLHAYPADLIEGVYLEPNALIASVISEWFNIPYGIKHGGSDIGSLFNGAEYRSTYTEIFKNADYIISGFNQIKKIHSIGVSYNNVFADCIIYPVREYFNPFGDKLDVNSYAKLVSKLAPHYLIGWKYYQNLLDKRIDTSLPTIGIYGKASRYKGHRQLLNALCYLKKKRIQI